MIYGVMIMKEYTAKAAAAAKAAVTAALFLYCIMYTEEAAAAVLGSVRRCTEVIIPSLYGMMIASSLVLHSGITGYVPRWAGRLGRLVFGMGRDALPVFTFGMLAGYPVGMKMLWEEYSCGRLTKGRAELLAGLCFGAGPAFIFGCISQRLYGSRNAGMAVLTSNAAANILLALFMAVPLRRSAAEKPKRRPLRLSADMLTGCVLQSGRAMGSICIMITAFSVFSAFLGRMGAVSAAGALIGRLPDLDSGSGRVLAASLLDVTCLGELPRNDWLLLPYISAVTASGGASVFFQLAALSSGKLSMKPFIIMRTAAAVLSFIICRLILPFFLETAAETAASVNVSGARGASPVPSVMLILMTVLLMREFGTENSAETARLT